MTLRLPDLLLIGAMKAGTTSLFRDLEAQGVFFPVDKEPGHLADDKVLTEEGLRRYAELFRDADPALRVGEASTDYTKRPVIEGTARRARQVLGTGARIVYLVRNPLARIESQYRFERALGIIPPFASIDEAVRTDVRYLAFSRYFYQLEPWIHEFGNDRVKIVSFFDYGRHRARVVGDICSFLGLTFHPERVGSEVYNRGDELRVVAGVWEKVSESRLYRKWIRPRLSRDLRRWIRHLVLPRANLPADRLSPDAREWIRAQLREDSAAFRAHFGFDPMEMEEPG